MVLSVATFNVESLDFGADAAAFASRKAALAPIFAALRADVICLQEVNAPRPDRRAPRGFAPLDALLEDTPYADFHRAWSRRPGADQPADVHNLAILSRRPILAQRQIHHDLVPAWMWRPPQTGAGESVVARFDRPILYAKIDAPGGPLHVLNLHLRAPRAAHLPDEKRRGRWTSSAGWAKGLFHAAQLRNAQALEARLFVEALFDAEPDARVLVCGDFNADSYETPTRILCGSPEEGDEASFAARYLERLEMRVQAELRHTVIHGGRRVLLDHILASRRLVDVCLGVEILNTDLLDERDVVAPPAGSLHAPVVARFDV